MHIQPIDEKNDLYFVKDAIASELIDELKHVPLDTVPFTKMEWQETIPRRKLVPMPGSIFAKIHENLNDRKSDIGNAIGKNIPQIDTAFWYDLEGFDFSPHIDNPGVDKVMQIYLSNCANAGTVFYDVEDDEVQVIDDDQAWHYQGPIPPTHVRKAFDFQTNTGYLMINGMHQLHGVPKKIVKGDIRLSVYCWI